MEQTTKQKGSQNRLLAENGAHELVCAYKFTNFNFQDWLWMVLLKLGVCVCVDVAPKLGGVGVYGWASGGSWKCG